MPPDITPEVLAALLSHALGAPVTSSADGSRFTHRVDLSGSDAVAALRASVQAQGGRVFTSEAELRETLVDEFVEDVVRTLERGGFRRVT